MNAMTGVLWAGYVRIPPCTTCKPGPDGTLTAVGWTVIVTGACVVLLGICVLLFVSRSDAGSHSASRPPAPVMDEAQRADLERRAARDSESGRGTMSDATLGGTLVLVGLGCGVFGLILLGITSSRINDDKSQLRSAAANLVSVAVDGPAVCRESAAVAAREWPSSLASSPYLPKAEKCDGSPREYAQQNTSNNVGVLLPVEYVFSSSYRTNGEVTVHDKQDDRSLCVTVPDTDVAAAARASATPGTDGYGDGATTSPNALPFFDDVSIDPSPYIRDGACPDAPVSSSGSS